MKKVNIADLKNNLSRHLAHVRDGGEITVFDRETPVARVIPYGPREDRSRTTPRDDFWTADRLDELTRQGVVQRPDVAATTRGSDSRPVKLPRGTPSLVALLLRMRRESAR